MHKTLQAALCFALTASADNAAPSSILLVPAPDANGWITGFDGRKWRMSDPAAVAARFQKDLPIDINHATELKAPKGEESPAAGWITGLRVTDQGIEAAVEWTPEGAEKVRNREYRFISPVFTYDKASRDIFQVTSGGLVNDPNLPLALNARQSHDEDTSMTLLERLIKALNLKSDASEDVVVAAVESQASDLVSARNAAETPSLDKFVPRADYNTVLGRATNAEAALADRDKADLEKAVNAVLDKAQADKKITPANREFYKAVCMRDGGLKEFEQFVASAPVVTSTPDLSGEPGKGNGLSPEQKDMCARLGVSEDEYAKSLEATKAS